MIMPFILAGPLKQSGRMYFANGAEIVNADIFAENGFIHIIDRVVEPLKNAFQILNIISDQSIQRFS